MIRFIKKMFLKHKKQRIELVHEVFGLMSFMHGGRYWNTKESDVFHSVPGDEKEPSVEAIDFIVRKLKAIDQYWGLCSEELLLIAHCWDSIDKNIPAKDLFKLSAISVKSDDNSEWEICFETKPQHKWIYIGLHLKDDEIVANDITT